MRKVLPLLFAVALVASVSGTAKASLLGDVVTMQHNFPTLGSAPQTPLTTAVTADASDGFQYFNIYFANPSDTSVRIDFQINTSWIARGPLPQFNGFILSDVDTPIQDVTTQSTNWAGWNDGRISHNDSAFRLSFESLAFNSSTFLVVDVDFGEPQQQDPVPPTNGDPIPEPASMTLLGAGLMGMIGFRKRKNRS